DAFGQLDVAGVQDCTAFQIGEVDFNALRQVTRQAGDFQFGDRVNDHGCGQLHSGRDVGVHEVQRHLGGDALVLGHTLEVNVQNLLLVGVPLHGAQQNAACRLTVNDEFENGGVVLFLANGVVGFVVIQLDVQGLGIAAVNDGGNTTGATQAAARTRTLDAARSGVEFHGMLQICLGRLPVVKRGRYRRLQAAATSGRQQKTGSVSKQRTDGFG